MTFSLPAGLEAWRKCARDGCATSVYGRVNATNYCREHGGDPAFQEATDEYGLPRAAIGSDGPPPPSGPRPLQETA